MDLDVKSQLSKEPKAKMALATACPFLIWGMESVWDYSMQCLLQPWKGNVANAEGNTSSGNLLKPT